MLLMFILMILIVLILIFMLLMNFFLSKKMFKNREKTSSFECGFDPSSKNRLPFSLQFYLISIIFLIFDVEIALILPIIFISNLNKYYFIMNIIILLFILLLGLYLEWLEGALKWFN